MEKILLQTLQGKPTSRPPVWLMRQAGRILPQYRELRKSVSGFKELVQTPELASRVTLQPVEELDVDAAIIFSDILVIPEAMGWDYEMIKGKGPYFPRTIQSTADIDAIEIHRDEILDRLQYVSEALQITRQQLAPDKTLIGFAGAPWTLMCYMIEGEGSKTFSKARRFLYQEPRAARKLLDLIAEATSIYLQSQIKAGAEVIQLFDSWAGVLNRELYTNFCLPGIRGILEDLSVPSIFFAKGAHYGLSDLADLPAQALGIDWTLSASTVRKQVGKDRVLQGNLDPAALYGPPDQIRHRTLQTIDAFGGHHILNLGHGVYPDTPLESVRTFVNTALNYSYSQKG